MSSAEFILDFIDVYPVDLPKGYCLGDLIGHNVQVRDAAFVPSQLLLQQPDNAAGTTELAMFELVSECQGLKQVVAELAHQGYRPADLTCTLFALSRCPAFTSRSIPFLALASAWPEPDGNHVPCVQNCGECLDLSVEIDDPKDGILGHYMILAHRLVCAVSDAAG